MQQPLSNDRTRLSPATRCRARTGSSEVGSGADGRRAPAVQDAGRDRAATAECRNHPAGRLRAESVSPGSVPEPSTRSIRRQEQHRWRDAAEQAEMRDRTAPDPATADRWRDERRRRLPHPAHRADHWPAEADETGPVPAEVLEAADSAVPAAPDAPDAPDDPAAPAVLVDAAAEVPESDGADRPDHLVPGVPADEHPVAVPDASPAGGGFPAGHLREVPNAVAARSGQRPCCPVHPWGLACCQAGWECSLTTPSVHRLRDLLRPVRSRRRCALSRAVCRLHRDSSTARPWSVGRLSEPAWQRFGLRHHWT